MFADSIKLAGQGTQFKPILGLKMLHGSILQFEELFSIFRRHRRPYCHDRAYNHPRRLK